MSAESSRAIAIIGGALVMVQVAGKKVAALGFGESARILLDAYKRVGDARDALSGDKDASVPMPGFTTSEERAVIDAAMAWHAPFAEGAPDTEFEHAATDRLEDALDRACAALLAKRGAG